MESIKAEVVTSITTVDAGNGWHNTLHSYIWHGENDNIIKYIKSQQSTTNFNHHLKNENNNNNNINNNSNVTSNDIIKNDKNNDNNNSKPTTDEEKSFSLEDEDFNLTPLSLAILKQNTSIVKILLDLGASPSNPGSRRTPPIFSAAANNSLDIVKLLLQCSAVATAEDHSQNCSAIHIAADKGHLSVVQYLVNEAHVDINLPASNSNMTPLHYSCSAGQLSVVKWLVEQKASVNTTNGAGNSPLILATNKGHASIVDLLLHSAANVQHYCVRNGFTALHSASFFNHPDIVYLLLSAGADINAAFDPFLHTPLHVSSLRGNFEVVGMLLDKGAAVDARNKPGATPLRVAASSESDLEDKSRFRMTAKFLLSAGADINSQNDQGNTPLHGLIVKNGDIENIAFCVEAGADTRRIKNKTGKTCLDLDTNKILSSILEENEIKTKKIEQQLSNVHSNSSHMNHHPSNHNSHLGNSSHGNNNSQEIFSLRDSEGNAVNTKKRWVRDDSVQNCGLCGANFSMWKRRHHCRYCGDIFCGECTTMRAMVPGYPGDQRVCDNCALILGGSFKGLAEGENLNNNLNL